MNKKTFLLPVLFFLLIPNYKAADWAQFRGPDSNGISTEKGINKNWKSKPPKILWKLKMTDGGHSIPSVADGKVYLLDHNDDKDIIKCLNLNTGEEIWKYEYKDKKDQKWGFTRIQPLIDNGNLYTISRQGKVLCLDAKVGVKKWEIDFVKDFGSKEPRWGFAASPIVIGEKLILCPGAQGSSFVAVNKSSGKEIWRGGGNENVGYSTPTIQELNGKKQIISTTTKGMAGIDLENGKVLWTSKFKTKFGNNITVPIAISENTIFQTAGYNHGCALFKIENQKGTTIWENSKLQSQFNSPVLVDGLIYGIGDPGKLICMNPKTGKTLWEERGFGKGGLIVVDNTIIAIDGKTGAVIQVKINPEKYQELGRINPLPKDKLNWVPPIVADKKLLVRNRKELICLDIAE